MPRIFSDGGLERGGTVNRRVGFTGSQLGMTPEQVYEVDMLLNDELTTSYAHHGDCIGADADFHNIARLQGLELHGHPPINPSKRAFCEFYSTEEVEEEKDYIKRNHDIVMAVDWMIACPSSFKEELRSGTWATIRWARLAETPGYIVWPDGKVTGINDSYA